MSRGKPANLASARTWLMREPKPTHVLCDGKKIDVPKTARPWPELFNTIVAMKPEQVQCCAGDSVLRACEWPSEDGGSDSDEKPSAEMSDVQRFAGLIAEAYERSDNSPMLGHMLNFIDRQGQQIAAKDREIERLRTHNMKLQGQLLAESVVQPVEGFEGEGMLTNLLSGFMASMQQANGGAVLPATPPAAPSPNGKGKRT